MSLIVATACARGSGDSDVGPATCVSCETSRFVDGGPRVTESLVSDELRLRGIGVRSLSLGATEEGGGCAGSCVSPTLAEGDGLVEVDAESPSGEDVPCKGKTSFDPFEPGSIHGSGIACRGDAEVGSGETAEEPGCGVF